MHKENSGIQQGLTSAIEDADIHIISQVNQAAKEKSKNFAMLSNHTDVLV